MSLNKNISIGIRKCKIIHIEKLNEQKETHKDVVLHIRLLQGIVKSVPPTLRRVAPNLLHCGFGKLLFQVELQLKKG